MFAVQIAGIRIGVENHYPFIERQCHDFLCETDRLDFTVSVTDEEISAEQKLGDFSKGYCESICIYRRICQEISKYNVFLMHSSVIEVDGYAYAFTAPSGTGKSTHTALWLKNIPGARVLNGDKPLFRVESDGSITACGTPWNGKENWGANLSAPLAGICFLTRGQTNSIRRADEEEIVSRIAHQVFLCGERDAVDRQLILMDALIRAVPFYVLSCNISDEAALLSYETMKKNRGRTTINENQS